MGLEIERKFRVKSDAWRSEADAGIHLRQGYILMSADRAVRARIAGTRAWLNIKATIEGNLLRRHEYEYEIPLEDAENMLLELAEGWVIEKTRHLIPAGALTWEVDVFEGRNAGLVVAEIELKSEDQTFDKPAWLGEEVTREARYLNSSLSQRPYSDWTHAEKREPGP